MIRLRHAEQRGSHIHVDVFMGPDADHLALCGRLVVRESEAAELQRAVDGEAVLRELEWSGTHGQCRICGGTRSSWMRDPAGHLRDCKLAALIPGAKYREGA